MYVNISRSQCLINKRYSPDNAKVSKKDGLERCLHCGGLVRSSEGLTSCIMCSRVSGHRCDMCVFPQTD